MSEALYKSPKSFDLLSLLNSTGWYCFHMMTILVLNLMILYLERESASLTPIFFKSHDFDIVTFIRRKSYHVTILLKICQYLFKTLGQSETP